MAMMTPPWATLKIIIINQQQHDSGSQIGG